MKSDDMQPPALPCGPACPVSEVCLDGPVGPVCPLAFLPHELVNLDACDDAQEAAS